MSINKQSSAVNNQKIAIKLTNVSKKYYIHHDKPTLAERILNGKDEEFYALKSINLTIYKGERIGIIGANGSGKTTLLKIITGITASTTGKVKTKGKIVSLIDLEAGFHPDLTGIQNIYLNGTLLGLTNKKIEDKLDEIVDFAGIGKFIDAPLFTYSSGMVLRLGFAVAVNSDPDTLILDENISVGDANFKQKSFNKIRSLFENGKTIVIASHDLDFLEKNTDSIIWISDRKIRINGPTYVVIKEYKKYVDLL